jgi:hypothetical protein
VRDRPSGKFASCCVAEASIASLTSRDGVDEQPTAAIAVKTIRMRRRCMVQAGGTIFEPMAAKAFFNFSP